MVQASPYEVTSLSLLTIAAFAGLWATTPFAMWSCIQGNFGLNSTSCRDDPCQRVGLALSVASTAYLVVCFPLGLVLNGLVLAVNLRHKSSINMPDVYFTNMALAGLILNLVAFLQLLGPDHLLWPVWTFSRELCMASFILFNMAALVSTYSVTLLSLDCFIERALPHTYMSSVYNTKHVCSFVWGGAALASFSSLLFYACSKISEELNDCSKLRTKELGDAIMVFTGLLAPTAGVGYALWLIHRPRKEHPYQLEESSRLDPCIQRLLLATVSAHFVLWLPYYLTLLVSTAHFVTRSEGDRHFSKLLHFLRGSSELLAYLSSCTLPMIYKRLQKSFSCRLRLVIQGLYRGHLGHPSHVQQQQRIATVSRADLALQNISVSAQHLV
ncbi:probable G-protein coupled receptor 146 isoform X2 [Stegostoma tigrinum]|nr:probable G-protein coupled receptor 146 isoform X2 [Stegostoma tigrinum]XP_048377614.1 probable G-protein coupled receptor 146 isoform X2 [Stegostoma tigrinum]XP_048377615.1 probable G-protein coupled receptor 146 isoform X2 [Stegostoma tigrinum]